LEAAERKVELRIIVDLRGTMLGRALCTILPIDQLSILWFKKADIPPSAGSPGASGTGSSTPTLANSIG
jgi:hypothetical protein